VHLSLCDSNTTLIEFSFSFQVFEASEIKTEVGAAIGVALNALRVLEHLGISRANLKSVPLSGVGFDILHRSSLF
jgi:hypothetical protein